MKNLLGYYRNLGSLRYGNEYCVEFDAVWEKLFFSSSTEAYFNHALITARRLVCKKNPQKSALWWRPSQWLCSLPQPAKIGGASDYIISCCATASQISSNEELRCAAHSTARNAVLVPISQGTTVTIVTE